MHTFARARRNFRNYFFSRGAREFIYSHLSTTRLFHNRFPHLLSLFFIFYKVNEIVPPPALLSTVFVHFSTIFYFLPLLRLFFGDFCFFKQKVIHNPKTVDNSILFFSVNIPLAIFVYKKSAVTVLVTAQKRKFNSLYLLFYVLLRCETHKNFFNSINLRFYRIYFLLSENRFTHLLYHFHYR